MGLLVLALTLGSLFLHQALAPCPCINLGLLVLALGPASAVLCPLSCVLCPVSCVLCPVSCVLCPVSCVLCPVSCVLCPVSCVLCPCIDKMLLALALCPVSCVLCPVSCVLALIKCSLPLHCGQPPQSSALCSCIGPVFMDTVAGGASIAQAWRVLRPRAVSMLCF